MKILIAPLNWGLGHASRCIPLIRQHVAAGDEVVIGGDGESLMLLQKHFPELHYIALAPLRLRYSRGTSQVGAMLRALPMLLRNYREDGKRLAAAQAQEHFDLVISDNRFGLYNKDIRCVYMTHQVQIRLPRFWRWAEPIAARLHARIYNRYSELWVVDSEDHRLAGWLSMGSRHKKTRYVGPLSRFTGLKEGETNSTYDAVAVLSGLEPQRSMLEEEIIERFTQGGQTPLCKNLLIVRGKMGTTKTKTKTTTKTTNGQREGITMVDSMGDEELVAILRGAKRIIARSGYSTIMDLDALGLLAKAELIPTPGQSEQEYLKLKMEN